MNIIDLIGNTPLLKLNDIFNNSGNNIYAKAEWRNPGGSLKDRPVKRMLVEAIKSGKLTKDKIIIDSSSGNAGIAYSMIGNALGYNVEIVDIECPDHKHLMHFNKLFIIIPLSDSILSISKSPKQSIHRRTAMSSINIENAWL